MFSFGFACANLRCVDRTDAPERSRCCVAVTEVSQSLRSLINFANVVWCPLRASFLEGKTIPSSQMMSYGMPRVADSFALCTRAWRREDAALRRRQLEDAGRREREAYYMDCIVESLVKRRRSLNEMATCGLKNSIFCSIKFFCSPPENFAKPSGAPE